MKHLVFQFFILLIPFTKYSQSVDTESSPTNRHELNINAFNLMMYKAPNISYEYLANENMSFGLGLLYKINQSDPRERGLGNIEVEYRIYSVTPYVRRYFSRHHARGFFIEGFGMLNSGVDDITVVDEKSGDLGETVFMEKVERYSHIALGITFGGKFLLGKKGILLETYLGMGFPGVIGESPSGLGAVTRGGVSLGYRF